MGPLMRPARRPKTMKIRVSYEIHSIIQRLAELTDTSQSECVADILENLLPGLKQTLSMLESSAKLNSEAKNNLIRTIEKHEKNIKDTLETITEEIEEATHYNSLKLPL